MLNLSVWQLAAAAVEPEAADAEAFVDSAAKCPATFAATDRLRDKKKSLFLSVVHQVQLDLYCRNQFLACRKRSTNNDLMK
jgi:hypothetical protein